MKTVSNHSRTKRQQLFSILAVLVVFGVAAFSFLPVHSAGLFKNGSKPATQPSASSASASETADADVDPVANVPQDAVQHAPSDGCVKCHTGVGDPHQTNLRGSSPSCVDCHGGNGTATTKNEAHTAKPRHPEKWPSSHRDHAYDLSPAPGRCPAKSADAGRN